MHTPFSFPDSFEPCIREALKSFGLTLEDSKALAKSVLTLSDYFITKPEASTPWNETWAQIAYLCYFLPLNATRIQRIIHEAEARAFFSGIENVIDFGAGLATASLTLSERHQFKFHLVERSPEPQKLVEKYFTQFKAEEWQKSWSPQRVKDPHKTLAVFSYSLTELADLPDWAYDCEALMLIEPSTQQDGRKLLALRQKLLDQGYSAWAPCTHQLACPLYTQSKHDWCHDRVHFAAPSWFSKLEEHLPMKNRTLTMSYVLMRKTPSAKLPAARVVGDQLKEKGKDRQLVCRSPEREFLAWMHKTGLRQEIPRGVLIEVPASLQKISNELRVTEEIKILK